MPEERGTSVPTVREAYKHLQLPVIDDAYENLHILTVLSTLGPYRLDAGRCTVASRFRCRSFDRGIRCQSALDRSLPSRQSS